MSDNNRSWTDTVTDTASSAADRARSAAPETYDRAEQTVNYAGESIRQHPIAASIAVAVLGYVLGFLLHHQGSDTDSARYSRGRDSRSWTDTATGTARSAADRMRSAAPETYSRAGQAANSVGESIRQYPMSVSVGIATLLGYGLSLLARRWPTTSEFDRRH
jgi:ElaB/YqjD/DUF883 family membrane-anchored ribosome-binding protein